MKVRWRTAVTVLFVAALFLPVAFGGDGVPLSTYGMYATPRSAETTFVVAVGQQADGQDVDLSPQTLAGTSDPLIVESYLRDEVRAGRAAELCDAIARRVNQRGVVSIEVRAERYNVVERVLGEKSSDGDGALDQTVLATCPAS